MRNGGSSDGEDERDYKDYFNEYAALAKNKEREMPGVATENKIKRILMNEDPDAETIEKQLSYLSKI